MKAISPLVVTALIATTLAGSCPGSFQDYEFGDTITDGPGTYVNLMSDATCSFYLPGPSTATKRTALRFNELHVEGNWDYPCLQSLSTLQCMDFPDYESELAKGNEPIGNTTNPITICSDADVDVDVTFSFFSDYDTVYTGFTAEIVEVDEVDCDNVGLVSSTGTNPFGGSNLDDFSIFLSEYLVGFIIAAVVVFCCCCCCLIGIIYFCCIRKKNNQYAGAPGANPYAQQPDTGYYPQEAKGGFNHQTGGQVAPPPAYY